MITTHFKFHTGVSAAILLCIASTSMSARIILATPSDDAVRLMYRYPANAAYRYDVVNVLNQTISMVSRPIVTNTKTSLGFDFNVKESVLNRSTIDINYTKATIKVTVQGFEQQTAPPKEIEIPNIVGKTSTVTISPTGSMFSDSATGTDTSMPELRSIMRSTHMISRLLIPLPPTDVIPGYKWTQDVNDTAAAPNGLGSVVTTGTITMSYRGTIDTLGTKCWIIDLDSKDLQQQGSYQTSSLNITTSGSGNLKGISVHEARTGAVISSETKLYTKITMNFSGQMSMAVPVESNVDLTINQVREGAK